MRARLIDLNNMETAELKTLNVLFNETKREVTDLKKAAKDKGKSVKGPNEQKWTGFKTKFEKDARAMTTQQLEETRAKLDAHAGVVEKLEAIFTYNFNQAEQTLGQNNIPRAIELLKLSREDVKKLEEGEKLLASDTKGLQRRVKRKLRDLQNEMKINVATSIGLRKEIPALQRTAAATKGLRGMAGKPIKIVGRMFGRP